MEDKVISKWLQLIFNEEQLISSNRNWLEIKFWSLFAFTISLLNFTFNHWKTQFISASHLIEYHLCGFLVLLLVAIWLLLLTTMLLFPQKAPARIKDIYSLKKLIYGFMLFIFAMVSAYIYIYFYVEKVYRTTYILLVPIFVLLLTCYQLSHRVSSHTGFEFMQVDFLKREKRNIKDAYGRIVASIVMLIFGGISLYVYRVLLLKFNLNPYSDIQLVSMVILIIILMGEVLFSRWTIDNLPDLKEFKFQVLSRIFKDENELIDRYEELLLGKSALRWLKDKCLEEKLDSVKNSELIRKIRRDIRENVVKKNVTEAALKSAGIRVKGIKDLLKYKEDDLKGGFWISMLNLTDHERSQHRKFLEKEIDPLILKLRDEVKELEEDFKALEALKI